MDKDDDIMVREACAPALIKLENKIDISTNMKSETTKFFWR